MGTLSGKLVTSHPTNHPPSHLSGLPPAQPPLGKSCQIRLIFAGLVNSPITWLLIKKLALSELKRPRNRPKNTIYSLRRALSRPFWFGFGLKFHMKPSYRLVNHPCEYPPDLTTFV